MLETFRHSFHDFKKAFSPPFRSRTFFACYLMISQQAAGIDGVLYYSPLLFRLACLASEQATFLASGGTALVILADTFPATFFADSWGRRTSALTGGFGIAAIMFLLGSLYAAHQVHPEAGAGRWVVIVGIYAFAAVFNATYAICFRAYVVESLPRETRWSGAALAQSGNWLANYVVALTTPPFLAASTSGPYFFFGGCALLCAICCAFWMQETRNRSLESIEAAWLEGRKGKVGSEKTPDSSENTSVVEVNKVFACGGNGVHVVDGRKEVQV